MKISITITDRYFSETICKECDDLFHESCAPLQLGDETWSRDQIMSERVQIIFKERRDSIKYLSNEIAEALIKNIKSKDTVNGYPREEWHEFAGE